MNEQNNSRFFASGDRKPKVAFVCVHNSCRSQIAECLGKLLASDVFDSFSAGTEVRKINPDAVRLIKQLYGADMEKTQYSKLLSAIPAPDIVILMGCNVQCPLLPSQYTENWNLEDPTGKSDEEFLVIIRRIEQKILQLKEKLKNKQSACGKSASALPVDGAPFHKRRAARFLSFYTLFLRHISMIFLRTQICQCASCGYSVKERTLSSRKKRQTSSLPIRFSNNINIR